MRYSQLFGKTKFEAPADADSVNAKLLSQGGFVERLIAGVYTFLPLGLRVLQKINNIIREEMNAIGGQEILMPSLHPRENWQQTGRDKTMDPILYRTKGTGDHDFVFGPSHEEIVTPLAAHYVQSYKDLPFALYQIQTKFRNEPRAKSGILRGREFGMKDMYSFHADEKDLDAYYEKATQAYFNVFKRCGLDAYIMEASGGAFSDKFSHEFSIKTSAGEDVMLLCEKCRYAQNLEIAEAKFETADQKGEEEKPLKKVAAKRGISVDENCEFHKVPAWRILKTVIYKLKNGLFGVCIRGDLKVDQARLERYLKEKVRVASKEELEQAGFVMGYISPIGLNIPFIADHSVKYVKNFVTGANALNEDYVNANIGRDFTVKEILHIADIELFCPKCSHTLREEKAIEAGNIFKLGTKFSRDFNLNYTTPDGQKKFITMGCYGIGNTRLLGTIVEACHDEHGIIWPKSVAPYAVHLLTLGAEENVKNEAGEIYKMLRDEGIEVLFDDREESAGKKFKDADLIGIPVRVIISRKTLEKGKVEVKMRAESEASLVDAKDILKFV
ncbi:MAG: proline--tRNA ligase [Patescibacteria group bacterium]